MNRDSPSANMQDDNLPYDTLWEFCNGCYLTRSTWGIDALHNHKLWSLFNSSVDTVIWLSEKGSVGESSKVLTKIIQWQLWTLYSHLLCFSPISEVNSCALCYRSDAFRSNTIFIHSLPNLPDGLVRCPDSTAEKRTPILANN